MSMIQRIDNSWVSAHAINFDSLTCDMSGFTDLCLYECVHVCTQLYDKNTLCGMTQSYGHHDSFIYVGCMHMKQWALRWQDRDITI